MGALCILSGHSVRRGGCPSPNSAPFCSSDIYVKRTSNRVIQLERPLPTFELGFNSSSDLSH